VNKEHPDGVPVDMASGSADARTCMTMQNTGDVVDFHGDWKITRPKHFMLSHSSWVLRRWDSGSSSWNDFDTKADKGGGVGLEHDLERLAITLSWGRALTKTDKEISTTEIEEDRRGMGADLYQNEVGSWRMGNDGVSEERKNKTQCAIALGGCIDSCLSSVHLLREMFKQGDRPSGMKDAENLMVALRGSTDMLDLLINGDTDDEIDEIRAATKRSVSHIRQIAGSLSPWKVDPEGDIQAVVCVLICVGIGGVLAAEWESLTGLQAGIIIESFGLPSFFGQWLWFICVFVIALLVLCISVLGPLTVTALTKGRGNAVLVHKKK